MTGTVKAFVRHYTSNDITKRPRIRNFLTCSNMGKLYFVTTPIGNLEDITLRALRVLKEVSLIAAEDTRETRKLLNHHSIKTSLISYYEKNKFSRLPQILKTLEDEDVALVSEAGMPGLNDPGYELVCAAIKAKIEIIVIPGPSAILATLSISGLPTSSFVFKGFLPRRKGERKALLESLRSEKATLVFFEAPHRLRDSLSNMVEVLGDRKIAIGREITKLYEEVFRGTTSQALDYFQRPRGEFTLVVEGNQVEAVKITDELLSDVERLRKSGNSLKESIKEISSIHHASSRMLYKAYLKRQKETEKR